MLLDPTQSRRKVVVSSFAFPTPTGDTRRTFPALGARLATMVVVLSLCVAGMMPVSVQAGVGTPAADVLPEPCEDGRLRIRDLEFADRSIEPGLDRVYQLGEAWEEDATLYSLRLVCPLLETGYQWEATFFSRTAQAFFETDTRQVLPAEDDPRTVLELGTAGMQIGFVYRSLVRAGFDANSTLGAGSGVTIRYNTDDHPFGPPAAPKGDVFFHVAIHERGEVIDIWVASQDGIIYRYSMD